MNLERDLDLLRPELGVSDYCDLLCRFYSLYVSWEPVAERLLWPQFPAWASTRSRIGLLRTDLEHCGRASAPVTPISFPQIRSTPAALGAMYVLEGSTLGSQLLTRHFSNSLGITPESGGAFFNGYGPQTGDMWREFIAELESYAARTWTDQWIIAGARTMFDSVHQHLCGALP